MAKTTGHLLKKLRALMKNTSYVSEAINAYIIPSGDAHQVNIILKIKYFGLHQISNLSHILRTNYFVSSRQQTIIISLFVL